MKRPTILELDAKYSALLEKLKLDGLNIHGKLKDFSDLLTQLRWEVERQRKFSNKLMPFLNAAAKARRRKNARARKK